MDKKQMSVYYGDGQETAEETAAVREIERKKINAAFGDEYEIEFCDGYAPGGGRVVIYSVPSGSDAQRDVENVLADAWEEYCNG